MTLPVSPNQISFNNVNVEIDRTGTSQLSLNDTDVRTLAGKPTSLSQIAMSDLHGKTWITQADVVTHVQTNRDYFHKWVHGGSGDNRSVNNPYQRNTSSSSWTATFDFSTQTLPDTTWTTIVVTLTASSPVFGSISVNGSTITTATEVYAANEQRQRVFHINTSYKNITSVYVYWTHTSANSCNFADVVVLPGKWDTHNSFTGYQNNVLTIASNAISVGSYYGGPNSGLDWTPGATPTGTAIQTFDGWWYNHGGFYMFTNPTGTNQSMTLSSYYSYEACDKDGCTTASGYYGWNAGTVFTSASAI